MTNLIKSALLASLVFVSIPSGASAENLTLILGKNDGGTAELVFDANMQKNSSFVLRTMGIGAPGARVMVSIDSVTYPLIDQVFGADHCQFGDSYATCEVEIRGGSKEYLALVEAFKAGLTAHLDVTNAGHPVMREDTSLIGFTRAFDAL